MQPKDEVIQFFRLALDDAYVCHSLASDTKASLRIICFHAQQAIEKSFKAILIAEGIVPTRTHDLTELAYMIEDAGVTLPISVQKLAYLTPYAVTIRYGVDVGGAMGKDEACDLMDTTISFLQKRLYEKWGHEDGREI